MKEYGMSDEDFDIVRETEVRKSFELNKHPVRAWFNLTSKYEVYALDDFFIIVVVYGKVVKAMVTPRGIDVSRAEELARLRLVNLYEFFGEELIIWPDLPF